MNNCFRVCFFFFISKALPFRKKYPSQLSSNSHQVSQRNLYAVSTTVGQFGVKFYQWCFRCHSAALTRFYQVLYVIVYLFPVKTTPHQAFHPCNFRMSYTEFLKILFCSVMGITTRSPYISILLQIYYISIFVDS